MTTVATNLLRRKSWPAPGAVDDLIELTDSIGLQRIDEAAAVARPAGVGVTHAEREFDALADE